MICGHDRDTLRMVLQREVNGAARIPGRVVAFAESSKADADIRDPAKLADIIAESMRSFGADVWVDGAPRIVPPRRDQFALFPYQDAIQVYPPTNEEIERSKLLTMPQARAFAIALLDSSQATMQDIERMIGEL